MEFLLKNTASRKPKNLGYKSRPSNPQSFLLTIKCGRFQTKTRLRKCTITFADKWGKHWGYAMAFWCAFLTAFTSSHQRRVSSTRRVRSARLNKMGGSCWPQHDTKRWTQRKVQPAVREQKMFGPLLWGNSAWRAELTLEDVRIYAWKVQKKRIYSIVKGGRVFPRNEIAHFFQARKLRVAPSNV